MTGFWSLSTFLILIGIVLILGKHTKGLEPLTTHNNLMDLAQLSGCAFYYLGIEI